MGRCDGCDKERRDLQSMGRDANGDPDAPDMCFLCRREWERGRRVYDRTRACYVPLAALDDVE